MGAGDDRGQYSVASAAVSPVVRAGRAANVRGKKNNVITPGCDTSELSVFEARLDVRVGRVDQAA